MKIVFKVVIGLLVLVALANVSRSLYTYWQHSQDPNRDPDALDHLTGKAAVDQFLKIKKKQDALNMPALRTAITMFYTQQGRYPQSMEELERMGSVGADVTRDQYGTPFRLQITNANKPVVLGAGPDQIFNTTDDVRFNLR